VKVALIAPPFIAVPPADYGGTELFVAQLARGLKKANVDVAVYATGDSTVDTERYALYPDSQWPIKVPEHAWIREINHTAWAIEHAATSSDIIHVQSAQCLAFSRFTSRPFVLTLHGPHEAHLSRFYSHYQNIQYVAISHAQAAMESLPKIRTIHHGIDLDQYRFVETKQRYLSFIGRIAPIKGTHIAIDVARRTGIPLKIAGEVQPIYKEYFEKKIKPQIDGEFVQYVGPADLKAKNELLGNSMAMLFPIQWSEPFGLVMVEAMACGTPVVAMPGGSVPEVVQEGVSGHICRSVQQMVHRIQNLALDSMTIRQYAADNFSIEGMVREYIQVYESVMAQPAAKIVA
jgi:glycosyltransferase involved in cell wall biosynthesis